MLFDRSSYFNDKLVTFKSFLKRLMNKLLYSQPNVHEVFFQLYSMKSVPWDPHKEILN